MITIWHNPRCSKSRSALSLIEASGHPHTIRKYLDDAPDLAELVATQNTLGVAAIDMLRPGEKLFKELGLTRQSSDADLLEAAAAHPILIERPIVFRDARAVIGRPPEAITPLLT